ncbi:MAG: hypothetical protein L0206_06355 [Actinobacteria bacterium]|nr:hypothetical protein [Actinomycetota bacterium]
MTPRVVVSFLAGALFVSALVGFAGSATAGRAACAQGDGGYTYAGHQASHRAHGVRATITTARTPEVEAGHVSGWVGVGGPGQGANGEDAWIQVGIAAMHGVEEPFLYAEIARGGRHPQLILLESGIEVGESKTLAVVEAAGRPGSWQVLVDGRPATKPVRLRGSSGRWAPIATAESWNGGRAACNRFAYRFEGVSVANGVGGSWRPFVSGHRFLDRGNSLRTLTPAASADARRLSGQALPPFAFAAMS